MINKKVIAKLKPCKDRFDNFIKFYGNRDLTLGQFMGLKNITQLDKMWVAFRLMKKENIKLAAADIAESVLHLYESKYPNDSRLKDAIVAARSSSGDKNTTYVAYAVANAADNAAASAAAYAAAYAANSAYAAYAAYAAANAAYAAHAAANAAANVPSSKKNKLSSLEIQEKLNRKICLRYLK